MRIGVSMNCIRLEFKPIGVPVQKRLMFICKIPIDHFNEMNTHDVKAAWLRLLKDHHFNRIDFFIILSVSFR